MSRGTGAVRVIRSAMPSTMVVVVVVVALCLAIRGGSALSRDFDASLVQLLVDASPRLFPRIRVSAYLCLDRDREIALSREMSKHRLAHEMRRRLEILEYPIEHRDLYVLDLDCRHAAGILREANSSGMFVAPAKWLLLRDRRPSVFGNETTGRDHRREILETFEGTQESDPGAISQLTDYRDPQISPVTKISFPWMLQLASRMNATVSFRVKKTWGYRAKNGSWDGMLRLLADGEIDIGGSATYVNSERLDVVHYLQVCTHIGVRFVFRQPLLSTVKNIFVLPFDRSVWISTGVLFLLILGLLCISTKWESRLGASPGTADYWKQMNPSEQSLGDNLFVVLGAVAQQGYPYEPYRVPARIVTLVLLVAVLSLYASYTANIVALLQSRSDSIRTMSDLLNSPLKLGALDTPYNRYFFASERDPVRKAMVTQKIEQPGQKSGWMTLEEGVRRIRDESFAFHGALVSIYSVMQRTYQEEEKCGISEIVYVNLAQTMIPVKKRSPYLEILKTGALLISETGLKQRVERRLNQGKPRCHDTTNFIAIGFTESYFALVSMIYGAILSLVVLSLELLYSKGCKGPLRETFARAGVSTKDGIEKTKDQWSSEFAETKAHDAF